MGKEWPATESLIRSEKSALNLKIRLTTPQLFHLHDRKDVPLLLSPTHEEEVTSIVASTLKSYKDLPIKLYQISMIRRFGSYYHGQRC
jgi:prolyl-tRNA synthetase